MPTEDDERPDPTQDEKRKGCFDEEHGRKEQPMPYVTHLPTEKAVVPASVVLRNLLDAGP